MKDWYKTAQVDTHYEANDFGGDPRNQLAYEIDRLDDDIIDLKNNLSIPAQTCPIIDGIIKELNNAGKYVSKIQNLNEGSTSLAIDYANGIDYELNGVTDKMETIRNANETLREIGKDWYNQCLSIMKRIKELQRKI